MTFRFVSNVDGTDFAEASRDLDPAETLFIISSKTFTTLETMTNAQTRARVDARRPGRRSSRGRQAFRRGLDQCRRRLPKFGIDTANMFGFWDWVGGRYSMDSAIGLSTMLAIGPEQLPGTCSPAFTRWTSTSAPRRSTEPAGADGLARIWYNDFFGAQTVAVLPYEQYLKRFPAYLQQLTMESNGKHVTLDGAPVDGGHGPDLLGRARHQRPALVLSAHPSGHAPDSVRFHRLSDRRSIRSARITTC